MAAVYRFLHSQLFVTLPVPTTSYTGKTVLVTGSNTGLGREAAQHFVRLDASTVILGVRNLDKGNAAARDIEASTGRSGVVKVMLLDMASYTSVLDFARTLEKEASRLDTAVLNAGVQRGVWELFEGSESTVTVNVLSTFLLAFSLLPLLRRTATQHNTRPTLTIVSSEVHEWTSFEERKASDGKIFEELDKPERNGKKVDLVDRYQVSKLLEILGVRGWCAERGVEDISVTINLVNPGFCHSEFGREGGRFLVFLRFLLARTTEIGSRTLVHAASQGAESHGMYLSDCKITPPSRYVLSEEGARDQERVWKELGEKLEGIRRGVTGL